MWRLNAYTLFVYPKCELETNYDAMRKKQKDSEPEVVYEEAQSEEYEETLTGGVQPHSTSDLGCAAALHCRGFSPIGLDRSDPQRVKFEFQRTRDVMSVVAAYWDGSLAVDAQSYFSSIRVLKNRLHAPD